MAVISRRVLKDGSVRFQAKVRRKGHKTLSATFRDESMAKQWGDLQEVRLDGFLLDLNVDTLKGLTVGDLIKSYAEEVAPTHRGFKNEMYTIGRWLRNPLGRSEVRTFDQAALDRYASERVDVSRASLRREFNILSAVFRHAKATGVLCHELNFSVSPSTRECGIYLLSFPNGMTYVGQSSNLSSRLYQHEYALRRRRHYNARLQEVVDKFGIDVMEVAIIGCDPSELNMAEQRAIDGIPKPNLLNAVNAPCTLIKA